MPLGAVTPSGDLRPEKGGARAVRPTPARAALAAIRATEDPDHRAAGALQLH